ncbi:DUF3107 domain-containing protein [Williamsia sterculiae]|uniref:ATP-binding protein n=1 Tax=Williamsia sterculiae TaxID=1344003 RepID=A0A1N7FYL6_9NOCA|nr:DUF3107 domain-containing protein [Williamsia sterculiae]SIS05412.1 Protein of unknown function [Williamsia sterculiae]
MAIDVKVGITDTPRELVVHTDLSSDDAQAKVEEALSGKSPLLNLVDDKGVRFLVPVTKIAYVEVGTPESRRVGFGGPGL